MIYLLLLSPGTAPARPPLRPPRHLHHAGLRAAGGGGGAWQLPGPALQSCPGGLAPGLPRRGLLLQRVRLLRHGGGLGRAQVPRLQRGEQRARAARGRAQAGGAVRGAEEQRPARPHRSHRHRQQRTHRRLGRGRGQLRAPSPGRGGGWGQLQL